MTDDPDESDLPVALLSPWSPVRPHLLPDWWTRGPNARYAPRCGACGRRIAFYCDPINAWRCWICVEALIR